MESYLWIKVRLTSNLLTNFTPQHLGFPHLFFKVIFQRNISFLIQMNSTLDLQTQENYSYGGVCRMVRSKKG